MDYPEIKGLFDQYVIGNYGRLEVAFVRGEGSRIWDSEGNRYVDLMPGWGTTLLGHCHPRVVTAVQRQVSLLIHVDNSFYIPPQGELARKLSQISFGGKCFFCNSGTEAIEAALKLARIHKEGEGRHKVISMMDSFHGRTSGGVRATGQPKYHRGVPDNGAHAYAPLNDLEAVKELADEQTCAVLVEPIQGEGGIQLASAEFMEGLREFCDEEGLLLILDEVQTGCGRTGEWFGYQHYGIEPDIMALAKALGSGVPIGAMVARPEVAASLVPGTHASTFGGNPVVCSAALATLRTIEEEDLLTRCRQTSEYIMSRFNEMAANCPIIAEVRGRGMMLGLELKRPGMAVFEYCLRQKVRLNCTHEKVIRILPAINIPREVLEEGLAVLERALARAEAGDI